MLGPRISASYIGRTTALVCQNRTRGCNEREQDVDENLKRGDAEAGHALHTELERLDAGLHGEIGEVLVKQITGLARGRPK
jgi:hypothetical protein